MLISANLATASFYSCPAGRIDREVDRRYIVNGRRMNMDGDQSFFEKRRACVNIRMIMNRMKAEDNIKNKTSQNKQKRPLTP